MNFATFAVFANPRIEPPYSEPFTSENLEGVKT